MNQGSLFHHHYNYYHYEFEHFISDLWSAIKIRTIDYTKEALEHLILLSLLYSALCVFLYVAALKWKIISFKKDVKDTRKPYTSSLNRVLFVTAHPDDECMFFGPSILNFTRRNDCIVYLMCLSTGNNYGMSKVRKNELFRSCETLGIELSHIMVYSHSNLPDQINTRWPIELVSNLILQQIESYNINTLVTFDKHGISYHLNHCSIYYAVAHLSIEKRIPADCSIYVLETVNLMRKYWLVLDLPISFILSRTRYLINCADRSLIQKAMKQHKSQLVWFRRLYMLFSRYMLINSLQEVRLPDIELDLQVDDESSSFTSNG